MNSPLTKFIAISSFALCANTAFADIRIGTGAANATPKNNAIADCVSAIQKHHDNDARLFLKNRGKYRLENKEHILNVEGWVWQNGERVSVSHQCVKTGQTLALNIQFTSDRQVAQQ